MNISPIYCSRLVTVTTENLIFYLHSPIQVGPRSNQNLLALGTVLNTGM